MEVIASEHIRRPLTEQEIAELIGVSRQVVFGILERARMKLRREILNDRESCALMRELCGNLETRRN